MAIYLYMQFMNTGKLLHCNNLFGVGPNKTRICHPHRLIIQGNQINCHNLSLNCLLSLLGRKITSVIRLREIQNIT